MCRESLINFDKYTITEDGKILSKYFNRYIGTLGSNGYMHCLFVCTDGKKRDFSLHRVIWYYFNGDIPEGMHVNHIDENTKNNALSNLNLLTPGQNVNWGTRTERMARTQRLYNPRSKPVELFDLETGEVIATFCSAKQAARQLGLSQANISRCCNGGYYDKRYGKWINITKMYDYGWRYINR